MFIKYDFHIYKNKYPDKETGVQGGHCMITETEIGIYSYESGNTMDWWTVVAKKKRKIGGKILL